jgi:hypothetical protein
MHPSSCSPLSSRDGHESLGAQTRAPRLDGRTRATARPEVVEGKFLGGPSRTGPRRGRSSALVTWSGRALGTYFFITKGQTGALDRGAVTGPSAV